MQWTGYLAAYATADANHPAGGFAPSLGFYPHTGDLRLGEASMAINIESRQFGAHLDGGYGDFYREMVTSDTWRGPNAYVGQAYVSWKPKLNAPVRLDVGKFWSSIGAETPHSYDNPNVSRSLLSWYGAPIYHLGARLAVPITERLTTSVQLLNGCNLVGGMATHASIAHTLTWTSKRWAITHAYAGGNVKQDGTGARHLSDLVLTLSPTKSVSGYVEHLFANEKRHGEGTDRWYGWATAWKYSPFAKWSLGPRLDWFKDRDGFTTGTAQRLMSVTLTGEYRPKPYFFARLEYRNTWSDQAFFERRDGSRARRQNVVMVELVAMLQRER